VICESNADFDCRLVVGPAVVLLTVDSSSQAILRASKDWAMHCDAWKCIKEEAYSSKPSTQIPKYEAASCSDAALLGEMKLSLEQPSRDSNSTSAADTATSMFR
jgi:hypothetical protein